MHTPWVEVYDRETNFGLFSGAPLLPGQNGNSRALYNTYNGIGNYQPRIGLAWTPGGGKTVIRAAYTLSSYLEGTGTNLRLTINPPFSSEKRRLHNCACPDDNARPGLQSDQCKRQLHDCRSSFCGSSVLSRGHVTRMGSKRSASYFQPVEFHRAAAGIELHNRSSGICGAESHPFDGGNAILPEAIDAYRCCCQRSLPVG